MVVRVSTAEAMTRRNSLSSRNTVNTIDSRVMLATPQSTSTCSPPWKNRLRTDVSTKMKSMPLTERSTEPKGTRAAMTAAIRNIVHSIMP